MHSMRGGQPVRWPVADNGMEEVHIGAGRVVLLGGAPGAGKTALSMQWAIDALRLNPDLKVLIANVEMPPPALLDRQLARISGIPLNLVIRRELDDECDSRIQQAFATLENVASRLNFLAPPFDRVALRTAVAEMGCQFIVLDYIQRFLGAARDARLAMNQMMDGLRELAAAEYGVLALSAVGRTRDNVGRSSYDPSQLGLASFRESGELEYGCDTAYLLTKTSQPGISKLKCVKNRSGELFEMSLEFDGSLQRYTPAASNPGAINRRRLEAQARAS